MGNYNMLSKVLEKKKAIEESLRRKQFLYMFTEGKNIISLAFRVAKGDRIL